MGESSIDFIEQQMMERGYLDSREMSAMFNLLRSNDLIWANVVNNYLMGNPPPAFDLLYWNSDGTRMARAAHSWYLRNTYVENNLIKPGKVKVMGEPIDLGRIEQDIYAVGAEKDHIVPWYAAWRITQLTGGRVRFVRASSGHIAGVINHPGPKKGAYWINEEPADLAGGLAGRRGQARGQLVDGLGRLAERALGREGEAAARWAARSTRRWATRPAPTCWRSRAARPVLSVSAWLSRPRGRHPGPLRIALGQGLDLQRRHLLGRGAFWQVRLGQAFKPQRTLGGGGGGKVAAIGDGQLPREVWPALDEPARHCATAAASPS